MKSNSLKKMKNRFREKEGPWKSLYVDNGKRLRNVFQDSPGYVLHFLNHPGENDLPVTGINPYTGEVIIKVKLHGTVFCRQF